MKKFKAIFGLLRNYRLRLVSNFFCNILNAIFSLFTFAALAPFLHILFNTGDKIDVQKVSGSAVNQLWQRLSYSLEVYIRDHGQAQTLILMCCFIMILALLKNLVAYLALLSIAHIRTAVTRDLRRKLYQKILKLPVAFFSNEKKGDLISRMTNDLMEIEFSVIGAMDAVLKSPVMIISSLITLFLMSWKLTLFAFLFLPVSGFLIARIAKSLKHSARKGKNSLGELMSMIEETLTGLRVIKVFNADHSFGQRFDHQNEFNFKLMEKLYRREYLASPMSEFISLLVISIMLYVGGNIVISGELDGKLLIVYLVIFSQIIAPARAFSDAFFKINKGSASLDRVNEILTAEESIQDAPNALPLNQFNNQIEFRNVTFGYHGDPVLHDINFTIKKGQKVALVGPSGGGKSTLASLLTRFYDPIQGDVLIDGMPLRSMKLRDIRKQMGLVAQDSVLFNDSVTNNIAIGDDHPDPHKVQEAARIANAEEFIVKLKDQYEFNIGDGGSKLSGGQKQRLAIARAIYKNPPILILDEATSALDTQSERMVQDAINNLMINRTSLVIAHRLSTVHMADLILVIDGGKIVERGTHDELIAAGGLYKKLIDMQEFTRID